MKGLIMAGGEGTRLRPLSGGTPKPMLQMMGVPVMEHIVRLLNRHGITDLAATLMYMPDAVTRHFGSRLHYYIEETPLGTAGSVKGAADFLTEDFIIVSGDAVCDFDLKPAIKFHQQKNALATMLLYKAENPTEYGLVVTGSDGKIERFLEKPDWGEVFSDLANTGIYILSPRILDFIPEGKPCDFAKDLFPKLLEQGEALYGYTARGYWCDIGSIGAYRRCHKDFLDGKINLPFQSGISPQSQIDPTAQIRQPCRIEPGAVIGAGAKILPYTVIGRNAQIGAGASVLGSIVLPGARVGAGASLTGAIAANNAQIGARCCVQDGCVVGENAVVGESCTLLPQVKIWNQRTVGSGVTVTNNVVWVDLGTQRLFDGGQITGTVDSLFTPTFISQIGAALGGMCNAGKIAVSAGNHSALSMLENALTAGIQLSGATVYSFPGQPVEATRQAVTLCGFDGAVHLDIERDRVRAVFLDRHGMNLHRREERALEQTWRRGDYPYAQVKNIQRPVDCSGFTGTYLFELCSQYRNMRRKTPVATTDTVCRQAMEMLQIPSGSGGIGVRFDKDEIILTDERGRTIEGEALFEMLCAVLADTGEKQIGVPVSCSTAVEELAGRQGAQVLHTKTGRRDIMHTLYQKGLHRQAKLLTDRYYAFLELYRYIDQSGGRLCDMYDKLPLSHMVRARAECETRHQGKVMRKIAAATPKEQVELTEGVRIRQKDGWALVLPRGEGSGFSVIAQGVTEEYARELCGFYCDQIKMLANAEDT